MSFNSLHFILFFPIVTILYYAFPHRFRWLLLLVASCYFYMVWIPKYILVLFFLILVDYAAALLIERTEERTRKMFLVASLVSNILILAVFKYFNFLNDNLTALLSLFDIRNPVHSLDIILPLGLSFHTFQSMSYTIEVYRGNTPAERHLGRYALYVMFFPQLVAGPIERATHLLPQFRQQFFFEYERVTDGLKLMTWGFAKKVVIADTLAIFVQQVFSNPTQYPGVPIMMAMVFFTFQVYCDFSGYSDIAIGAAKVLGFTLMKNFDRPFHAESIAEFWRRWHISLSTWFRDYLYIPMGGNRGSKLRQSLNIMVVFAIVGLWHGADWRFINFGLFHGLCIVTSLWTVTIRKHITDITGLNRLPAFQKGLRICLTFSLVCVGSIIFRAFTVSDMYYMVTHVFSGVGEFFLNITDMHALETNLLLDGRFREFMVAVCSIALLLGVQAQQGRGSVREMIATKSPLIRWGVYYIAIMFILAYGKLDAETAQEFVYFQF